MRVAILALSLFGIAASNASTAQGLPTAEAPGLGSTVPAIAMNSPTFNVPELVAPVLVRPPSKRAGYTRTASPGAAQDFNMGATGPLMLPTRSALVAPHQPTRSLTDHLLTGVVALMLIGHQLRRKHRVLRPHPFTT